MEPKQNLNYINHYSNGPRDHSHSEKADKNEKKLTHKQVTKEKLAQLQDQSYSNDTLCRLLSVTESLAIKISEDNKQKTAFNYYDSFNSSKIKNNNELYVQMLFEIETFKASFEDYVKKYQSYGFPSNLPIKNIEAYIQSWSKISNGKIDNQLKSILGIFKSDFNFSYRNDILSLDKNTKVDPNLLMNYYPIVAEDMRQRGEQVKTNYEQGNEEILVSLNQNFNDSKLRNSEINMLSNKDKEVHKCKNIDYR